MAPEEMALKLVNGEIEIPTPEYGQITLMILEHEKPVPKDADNPGEETRDRVLVGMRVIDVVVSDISPHITGKWDIDQAVSLMLVADVFDFALPILKYGGHFVTKLFQGVGVEELIEIVRPHFQTVKRFSPMASRNSSSEVYLVCKFHTPKRGPDWEIRPAFEQALEERQGGPEPLDEVEPAKDTFTIRRKNTPKE